MATAEKASAVEEIADALRSSSAAVLTEYRGLTVGQLRELRRSLAGEATYSVVKNTLTKIAVRGSDVPEDEASKIEALLEGPTAIAFVNGDPVTAAKGLRDFAKANPLLVIKGGIFDNRALTADEIRRLADLESREVLLAKVAGASMSLPQQAVSLFAAPLAQVARLAAALQEAAAANPSLIGGAGAPAETAPEAPADAAEADAPAAEAAEGSDTAAAGEATDAEAPQAEAADAPAADAEAPEQTADESGS